jgi:glycosyltransferase involved in cell wall biosynthesis
MDLAPGRRTDTVAILLSIYNGEKYLRAQLESLGAQTHRDWILLWRDDGSTDGSREIMQGFADMIGHWRCREIPDTRRHVGAARSYMALLRAAEGYPLVALTDQDDVWLEHKLARAVTGIGTLTERDPALYCARQIVVDEDLCGLGESMRLRHQPGFPDALVQNIATGCTIVLNHRAVELINAFSSPPRSFHDWWCYIVVSAADGRIIADDAPVILYRQHRSNAIGLARSPLGRAIKACGRGPVDFVNRLKVHVAALQRQRHLLSTGSSRELDAVASALTAGPIALAALVLSGRLKRQTWLETVILVFWLSLGAGFADLKSSHQNSHICARARTTD